ncbi:DNA polymerase III subunit delta' [Candidatus Pantoea edessiphila]|uniref:DNA polymerase III subunit delta' n=1 Tax=Candidatus Pantoea edessiphila TaxID=2044610 RepID=A0A2P5T2I0_9GAMM|nr:DNA polymerase III subunit delta' C-terminal domain-containing protein [Candidatus Pantoea edessiphila]PPI88776.1 DNA polymerase III subunit delta' [Candidatus Pantoea edessiphila]
MNDYPWIDVIYFKIITQYQKGFIHPVVLIQGIKGIGAEILILKLSYWLLCQERNDLKNCGRCKSCKLMQFNSHPDYYKLKVEKREKTIGVDMVRNLIDNLYICAHQSNKKVVWLENINQLTTSANNALLKIIEEPPYNTCFFLNTENISTILPTIRSRCMILRLSTPSEEESLTWLKKQSSQKEIIILSALRLSFGIPIAALNLIKNNWELRKKLCDTLFIAFEHDILQLLPIINKDKELCINWLISLLLDAMKLQNNITKNLTNLDRKDIVLLISRSFSFNILNNIIYNWIKFRDRLMKLEVLNEELLLTNLLLKFIIKMG